MSKNNFNGLIIKFKDTSLSSSKMKKVIQDEIGKEWQMQKLGEILPDLLISPTVTNGSISDYWNLKYKLEENDLIERVETDFIFKNSSQTEKLINDKIDATQNDWNWALHNMDWHLVKDIPLPSGGKRNGEGIYIAQFDSGYTKHPEYYDPNSATRRLRVDLGWDFISNDNDPKDETISSLSGSPFPNGHGTGAGSVIISDFGGQLIGAAHRSYLIPMRVTDYPWFNIAPIVSAVDYSLRNKNIDIISMSIGSKRRPLSWYEAFTKVIENGVIPIAAAGQVVGFLAPANFPNVIACTGSTKNNQPWILASADQGCDISAPAENIGHAKPGTQVLDFGSGTTFSTSFTSAAAAMWLAHWDKKKLVNYYGKHQLVKLFTYMLKTYGYHKPLNWDVNKYGVGILNINNLLRANPFELNESLFSEFEKTNSSKKLNNPISIFSNILNRSTQDCDLLIYNTIGKKITTWTEYYKGTGDELAFHLENNTVIRDNKEMSVSHQTEIINDIIRSDTSSKLMSQLNNTKHNKK
jgi:hypothetical protein